MLDTLPAPFDFVLVSLLILAAAWGSAWASRPAVRHWAHGWCQQRGWLTPGRPRPTQTVGLLGETAAIALAAGIGALGLGLGPRRLGLGPTGLALLPSGVVLGLGEFAAIALLSTLLAQISFSQQHGRASHASGAPGVSTSRPALITSSGSAWLALLRTEWIRRYRSAGGEVGWSWVFVLVAVQSFGVESLLRADLLIAVRSLVTPAAVLVGVVGALVLGLATPLDRRDALCSVPGAVVFAVVHGVLFLATRSVLPLVAADLTFYAVAVL